MTSETRQAVDAADNPEERATSGLLEATFGDIEEFSELVRDWDLDFRQLDRGGLSASLVQRAGLSSNITRVCFDRAVAQTGGPPPGMRTFGIQLDKNPSMEWCGQSVEPDSLLCFHPSEEFQCLSPPGFAVFSLSLRESQLADLAAQLGHPGLFDGMRCEHAIDAAGATGLAELRRLLPRMFAPHDTGAVSALEDEIDSLEAQIAEELVILVVEERCDPKPLPLSDRSRAVSTAVSYILDHAQAAVSVSAVCEATDVSWRTLDRAFKEKLGASPKNCITGVRLRGVRRELLKADPEVRVTDIANEWGYWHMGDFAMNYRREFGELPSATLAKGRGGHTISRVPASPTIDRNDPI
jgi:AraC family ethanolamine operon transcriptional activator